MQLPILNLENVHTLLPGRSLEQGSVERQNQKTGVGDDLRHGVA